MLNLPSVSDLDPRDTVRANPMGNTLYSATVTPAKRSSRTKSIEAEVSGFNGLQTLQAARTPEGRFAVCVTRFPQYEGKVQPTGNSVFFEATQSWVENWIETVENRSN